MYINLPKYAFDDDEFAVFAITVPPGAPQSHRFSRKKRKKKKIKFYTNSDVFLL